MKVPHSVVGRTRPSSQPLAYLSSAGATPEAFGAGIGAGIGVLGRAFEGLREREQRTDRFTALSQLSDFQTSINTQMEELKRNADPTGKGFRVQAEAFYKQQEEKYLASLPRDLQDEFRVRTRQISQSVLGEALDFQYKSGDAWFRTNIDKEYQKALRGLDPRVGGDPAELETWRTHMFEVIEASDLLPAEKYQLMREVGIGMEGVSYRHAYKTNIMQGAINLPDSIGGVIDEAAIRHGVDPKALRIIAWLESSGDPTAQNENSSAGGLFQFIDKTAGQYGLRDRFDPAEASDAAARLAADNTRMFQKEFGRPPNAGELYLMHQQGGEGALNLLRNSDRLAVDVVGYKEVMQNKGAPGMTAGEFAKLWIDKATRAAPDLDNDPSYSNLPFEDRINLQRDATTEATNEMADLAQQRKMRIDAQVADLIIGITNGQKGRAHLDDALLNGWFEGDHASYTKALGALEKYEGDASAWNAFQGKLDNPYGVFDPTNAQDKEGMDLFFQKTGGQEKLAQMDQDYVTNVLNPLVGHTGMIPGDAIGTLTGLLRSNNLSQSMFALDTLSQMRNTNFRAFVGVNDALVSDLNFYEEVKDLYPPAEIKEIIDGGRTQDQRQANAILDKEAETHLAQKTDGVSTAATIASDIIGSAGGVFRRPEALSVPMFAAELERDYASAFKIEYRKYRDVEKADEAARKIVERNWGETRTGGRHTFMKHPPEKTIYPTLDGSLEWIDRSVMRDMGLKEGETFQLLSDDQTTREVRSGLPPSYLVVPFDESGIPRFNPTQGRIYFEPDPVDVINEERRLDRSALEDALFQAQERKREADKYYGSRGEPTPAEFTEEAADLQQRYNLLSERGEQFGPEVPPPPQPPARRSGEGFFDAFRRRNVESGLRTKYKRTN